MKNLFRIFILIICISFGSCDRLVTNIDPPKAEKELVLFAFISPEASAITAELSYSSPVFGTNNLGEIDFISNAIVIISNNEGNSDTLKYDSTKKSYESQTAYKIEPGKTYKIRASYDGKIAEGITTVPIQAVAIDTIDVLKFIGPEGESKIKIKTNWDDPGKDNYYYRSYIEHVSDTRSGEKYAYEVCSEFISNSGKEGKKLNSICESYYYDDNGSNTRSMYVYLLTTDIHYYEYNRRRVNYYGDDPFSEPVPQYMNVKGGLGVVSSYRMTKLEIRP